MVWLLLRSAHLPRKSLKGKKKQGRRKKVCFFFTFAVAGDRAAGTTNIEGEDDVGAAETLFWLVDEEEGALTLK